MTTHSILERQALAVDEMHKSSFKIQSMRRTSLLDPTIHDGIHLELREGDLTHDHGQNTPPFHKHASSMKGHTSKTQHLARCMFPKLTSMHSYLAVTYSSNTMTMATPLYQAPFTIILQFQF